jgi:hypothetical protein
VNGALDCFSEAYASVLSSESQLDISYSTSDTNSSCPPVVSPLSVTMSGPSTADFTTATCSTLTWSASASGGTTPYSYNWYYNGTQVGTGASYSRSVCYNAADFTVQATVTDGSSPVQSKSVSRAVDVTYAPPPSCSVTITGTDYEYFTTTGCRSRTWTANVSGCTPSTYQWKWNGSVVGSGSTYTRSLCAGNSTNTLDVTVNGTAYDSHTVILEYERLDSCGTNGQICP